MCASLRHTVTLLLVLQPRGSFTFIHGPVRFLGWADTNREAIEQLDISSCRGPSSSSGVDSQVKVESTDANEDRKPSAAERASQSKSESEQEAEQQQPLFHFFGEGVQ
jgi:hypothetical protein